MTRVERHRTLPSLGIAALLGFWLVCGAERASAHLMPQQQGTLHVLGNGVFVAISLPVSAIHGVDDDGDGRLSPAELRAHGPRIRAAVQRHIRLADGHRPGRIEFLELSAEADDGEPASSTGSTHFLVLMKVGFTRPPTALRLEADFWGRAASEQQLTIRASRGSEIESVVLSPRRTTHRFFRSAAQVFCDFVVLGAEHVLSGIDHLLFLLTILLGVVGLRAWLGVTASFTLAHSLTLMASLLGAVHVPAGIVEPAIALSIVFVALLNLRRRSVASGHRLALVFACGLVHGLGFASNLDAMGLRGANRLATVVGFNLGIELGQLAFLGAAFGIGFVIHARARGSHAPGVDGTRARTRWLSLAVALIGGLWFVARLGSP